MIQKINNKAIEPKISTKQACVWVDGLRKFAMQNNSDSTSFERYLDGCMQFIETQSSTKQPKIKMFFN
jgi:hypothetical protein